MGPSVACVCCAVCACARGAAGRGGRFVVGWGAFVLFPKMKIIHYTDSGPMFVWAAPVGLIPLDWSCRC